MTPSLKDASVVTLPFEYVDIGTHMLLHVSDSELLVTSGEETTLKRQPASKEVSVTKGVVCLLKLQ